MFSYSIRIKRIPNPRGKIVAFASITIDEVFQFDGFKVIDGSKGLFVSHPQHKGKDKEGNDTWYDDARFVGDQADGVKQEIHKAIIHEYNSTGGNQYENRAQTAQSNQQASTAAPSASNRTPLW
jgi:DNA-binding cell septation regulator SpoVG